MAHACHASPLAKALNASRPTSSVKSVSHARDETAFVRTTGVLKNAPSYMTPPSLLLVPDPKVRFSLSTYLPFLNFFMQVSKSRFKLSAHLVRPSTGWVLSWRTSGNQ